jgi:DNA modification methylase
MTYEVLCGDCLELLPSIPSGSIDAVITDPPYPMIKRDYGMLTEAAWFDLMMGVCSEVRRILKPSGSAVFILQPNSAKVGSIRGWLWRFMYWVTTDWNMVQDAYWWNYSALPTSVCTPRERGLMRPSVKACVWAGASNCYRSQDSVLIDESAVNIAKRLQKRYERRAHASGQGFDDKGRDTALERGGSIPFNLFPYARGGGEAVKQEGHGAGTPLSLADWWVRYIVPAGGVVVDPFNGAGTMGIAAVQNGASYIGIEKMPKYVDVSLARLAKVQPALVQP